MKLPIDKECVYNIRYNAYIFNESDFQGLGLWYSVGKCYQDYGAKYLSLRYLIMI